MSDRNRGQLFAVITAGAVALVLILLGALVYEVAVSHTERKLRAEHNSEYQQQAAEQRIEARCLGLNPVGMAECIKEEIEASGEAQRGEYDLSAQQDMSDWAFWMIWISVASVAVTSIGVAFVWRTLEHTTEALKEARRATKAAQDAVEVTRTIGQNQLRAYLVFTPKRVKFDAIDPAMYTARRLHGRIRIRITGELKNFGHTPASDIRTEATIACLHLPDARRVDGVSIPRPAQEIGSLAPGDVGEAFYEQVIDVDDRLIISNQQNIVLVGVVAYETLTTAKGETTFTQIMSGLPDALRHLTRTGQMPAMSFTAARKGNEIR